MACEKDNLEVNFGKTATVISSVLGVRWSGDGAKGLSKALRQYFVKVDRQKESYSGRKGH